MHLRRNVCRLALGAAGLYLICQACAPQPGLAQSAGTPQTATPIRHLVVIFQENVSFDHYFATYPKALNPPGEPPFIAAEGAPTVNGLGTLIDGQPAGVLLTDNPNANNPANSRYRKNPFRLNRSQASTCDQNHNYGPEQQAFDERLISPFAKANFVDNTLTNQSSILRFCNGSDSRPYCIRCRSMPRPRSSAR